jgi:poly-gamma-glutamate synthesis protein (capsule biosynthesis protein)
VQNSPIKVVVNGFRLAIINYTYGTNGIPVRSPNLVNHLDRDLILKDIREAQTFNPDEIIAFVHWGREYETSPNKDQTSLAAFLHENGVNLVIGSHPHVIQPMHLTEDPSGQRQLVVYSLGNFISNQRQPLTDGGAMVRVVLKRENDKTVIHKD